MKKQEQKTVGKSEMEELIKGHKLKEVAPPQEANKDMLTGKYNTTAAEAAKNWFKAAKSQNPSSGFLEVPSEGLKPLAGSDREMLYKGKKKQGV